MNNALKDLFGPMFEAMLKGEMNHHLGYDSNDKGPKKDDNRRNGYGTKTLKTSQGEVEIEVPRDRDGSFEPQVIPKRKKDVSAIEKRYWPCMHAACRRETSLQRSRIFTASQCLMK